MESALLSTQALEHRVRSELRLRRVPVADHRDPAGPPPVPLMWHARTTTRIGEHEYRIEVPCHTMRFDSGVHPRLSAILLQRWSKSARHRGWRATSVVAAFEYPPGEIGRLVLAISASAHRLQTLPLDNFAMARDLNEILTQLDAPVTT